VRFFTFWKLPCLVADPLKRAHRIASLPKLQFLTVSQNLLPALPSHLPAGLEELDASSNLIAVSHKAESSSNSSCDAHPQPAAASAAPSSASCAQWPLLPAACSFQSLPAASH
jgi:Leucine-rich repeat (LRR) protein